MTETRRAKKLADLTLEDSSSTSHPKSMKTAGTGSTMGSTAFGKKFTQSGLGSTAFPDTCSDSHGVDQDGTNSNSVHVHRNHRAAGIVFGLALVQRLFNRYANDGEDKTQLLVLFIKAQFLRSPLGKLLY